MSDEFAGERRAEYLSSDFKNHILGSLREIKSDVESVDKKLSDLKDHEISKIKVEVGMLKVKAGVWGLAGGALGVFMLVLGRKLGI